MKKLAVALAAAITLLVFAAPADAGWRHRHWNNYGYNPPGYGYNPPGYGYNGPNYGYGRGAGWGYAYGPNRAYGYGPGFTIYVGPPVGYGYYSYPWW